MDKEKEFVVHIPPGVHSGEAFNVRIGQRTIKVQCPDTHQGGMSLTIAVKPGSDKAEVRLTSDSEFFVVTCPPGKRSGQTIIVTAPSGTKMRVKIPARIQPGMKFPVRDVPESKRKLTREGQTRARASAYAIIATKQMLGSSKKTSKQAINWRFIIKVSQPMASG